MTKHTPGPWRVSEEAGNGKCEYKDICRTWIIDSKKRHNMAWAEAWAYADDPDVFDEVRANMNLMVAAPEMFECLTHIRQTPEFKHFFPGTVELLEATLKKANGE